MIREAHSAAAVKWVLDRVESFEQVHVLRAVVDSDEGRASTDAITSSQAEQELETAIGELVESALLARDPKGVLTLPTDEPTASAVRAFVAAFESDPLPILRHLNDRSLDRVRSAAVRTFADAFVFRRRRD
jgi:hypothetical protein